MTQIMKDQILVRTKSTLEKHIWISDWNHGWKPIWVIWYSI